MEHTQPVDYTNSNLQSPEGDSASEHDVTLIGQQAYLHASPRGSYRERSFFGSPDSILCATLLGSGAFADDKAYYCGLSPIDIGTAVEDMSRLWDAPVDLSKYLASPKMAPSDELTSSSHGPQMESVDPSERTDTILLFNVSPRRKNESPAFDATPPSLRRIQEKLAMKKFSGLSSHTPDVFNYNALGITHWSPSQQIQDCTPPWADLRALEFHPMFCSPESGGRLSAMHASGTYSYGPTYTPSLTPSDTTGTPPIDSMIKQKLAAQERRPAAGPSAHTTSPPSPWFARHTGGSSGTSANSSLSRQLFEKLLRESCSPRPTGSSSRCNESRAASSDVGHSGFFSPEPARLTGRSSHSLVESTPHIDANDCGESICEGNIIHTAPENERQLNMPHSVSADSVLFQLLRRCTTVDDSTTKPARKAMRTIATQTDPTPIPQPPRADQTASAIRIVALRSMRNLVSELARADQVGVGNPTAAKAFYPGSFSVEARCDEEGMKVPRSIIGRLVRFVLGW